MAFWHGIPLGVDFRGGTLVVCEVRAYPDPSAIHNEIERAGLKNARVQRYGAPGNNEVLIGLDIQETSEQDLSNARTRSNRRSKATRGGQAGSQQHQLMAIKNYLLEKDPLQLGSGTEANPRYTASRRHCRLSRQDERRRAGSIEELKTRPSAVVTSLSIIFLSRTLASAMSRSWAAGGQQLRKQAILRH